MLELLTGIFQFLWSLVSAAIAIIGSTLEFGAGTLLTLHNEMPRLEGFLLALLVVWFLKNRTSLEDRFSILKTIFMPIGMLESLASKLIEKGLASAKSLTSMGLGAVQAVGSKAVDLSRGVWNRLLSALKRADKKLD